MCSNTFYKLLTNKYLGYITKPFTNIDTIYSPTKYSFLIKGTDTNCKNLNATLLEGNSTLEKTFTKKDAETDIYSVKQ